MRISESSFSFFYSDSVHPQCLMSLVFVSANSLWIFLYSSNPLVYSSWSCFLVSGLPLSFNISCIFIKAFIFLSILNSKFWMDPCPRLLNSTESYSHILNSTLCRWQSLYRSFAWIELFYAVSRMYSAFDTFLCMIFNSETYMSSLSFRIASFRLYSSYNELFFVGLGLDGPTGFISSSRSFIFLFIAYLSSMAPFSF